MARYNSALTSNTITGTATIGSPYSGAFTEFTGTAPYTVTLPTPVAFPGVTQTFYNATSGTVTLSTPTGIFVGTGSTGATTIPIYSGNVVSIVSDGTNYVVISEDGSPLIATTGSFSGNVTINGGSATLAVTPSVVTMAPTASSTIDNIAIGATTRASGAFTTLTANNAVTLTANTASSSTTTGSLVVTGGIGASGTIYAGAFNGNLTGTLQTASQPNITSVGTLTSLTVSGNILSQAATTASAGSIQVTASDASLRLKWTSSPVSDKNTWEIRSVGTGATPYLQFRTINDANTVFTDRVAFTNDGNVGIGTATPGHKLDVAGTVNAQGIQTSGTASLSFGASKWMVQQETTAQSLSYYCGPDASTYGTHFLYRATSTGTPQIVMTYSPTGNVGIGTTAPGANLEIANSAPTFILNANTQSVNSKKIRLASSNNNAGDFVVSAINDDNSLKNYMFYASNAGNIGLGSTAPGTYGKLDIYQATDPGTTPAALSVRLQGVAGGSGAQYGINVDASQSYNNSTPLYGIKSVASQNTGQTTYGVHSTVNAGNSNTARFGVYGKSGFNSDAVHGLTNSTLPVGVYGEATNATGTTQLSTSAAGYFLNSSTLGAVSLGVYINTTAGPTSVVPLRIDHASSELLRVDSAGRMGIGTDAPGTGYAGAISNVKLALRGGVVGSYGGVATLLIGSDNNHYSSISSTHTGGGQTYLTLSTSASVSNPIERMRIDSAGKPTFSNASIGLASNATTIFTAAGSAINNQTISVTISTVEATSCLVVAMHDHYGLLSGYGCARMSMLSNGNGGMQEINISNSTSGNGGAWTFANASASSFTITKSAGSYVGGGYYTIIVIGNYISN